MLFEFLIAKWVRCTRFVRTFLVTSRKILNVQKYFLKNNSNCFAIPKFYEIQLWTFSQNSTNSNFTATFISTNHDITRDFFASRPFLFKRQKSNSALINFKNWIQYINIPKLKSHFSKFSQSSKLVYIAAAAKPAKMENQNFISSAWYFKFFANCTNLTVRFESFAVIVCAFALTYYNPSRVEFQIWVVSLGLAI